MQDIVQNPVTTRPPNRASWVSRDRVVRGLETIQDLIVISLCIGLFCFMLIQLRAMFISLLPPLNFRVVTADILFLLILVELFRLLIIYLQEQRVSIGVAVEVAIVSVLREVIVRGVLEVAPSQVLSACGFLLVMAILMVVRVWLPPTFNGIDPERRMSQLARAIAHHPVQSGPSSPIHELSPPYASSYVPVQGSVHLNGHTNGHSQYHSPSSRQ